MGEGEGTRFSGKRVGYIILHDTTLYYLILPYTTLYLGGKRVGAPPMPDFRVPISPTAPHRV